MALIEISETQLAFGYFHSFMNVYGPRGFIFPSIRQEGGRVRAAFPGADFIIDNNHLVQFKRPYFFKTASIKEFWHHRRPSSFDPPFYRFNIKNDNPTNQLDTLIAATHIGLKAEYISPIFNNDATFFRLLANDRLHLQSYVHIDIAQFFAIRHLIGSNNDHTVLYNQDSVNRGLCYCFSETKPLKASFLNSNNVENPGVQFEVEEIIDELLRIFFPEEKLFFLDSDPMNQIRMIQQKLLIEKDIIWTFRYHRK